MKEVLALRAMQTLLFILGSGHLPPCSVVLALQADGGAQQRAWGLVISAQLNQGPSNGQPLLWSSPLAGGGRSGLPGLASAYFLAQKSLPRDPVPGFPSSQQLLPRAPGLMNRCIPITKEKYPPPPWVLHTQSLAQSLVYTSCSVNQ